MLHRDSKRDKFVEEPCQVDSAFIFRDDYYFIIFFRIFRTEFHNQAILRLNGLLHIVQATVAGNNHYPFELEVHLEHQRHSFHRQRNLHIASLHLVSFNVSEELIVQKILIIMHSRSEILQINAICFKFSQCLFV